MPNTKKYCNNIVRKKILIKMTNKRTNTKKLVMQRTFKRHTNQENLRLLSLNISTLAIFNNLIYL